MISGKEGLDTLVGGAGNDSLNGGTGNDSLSGEAGNDVYLFSAGDGRDSVDNLDVFDAVDTLRFGASVSESDVLAIRSGNNLLFKIKNSTDQVTIVGHYAANTTLDEVAADRKIDLVEFANGTVWDQAMIQAVVDRANNNHAPTVNSGLPTLKASQGNLFTYVVPLNTITDPDVWDSVTYTAKMSNGDPLPSWLSFDSQTRTFSGTPTSTNIGSLQFVLWGTDNYGRGAGTYVNLTVSPPNRAPVVATALADQSVAEGTAINYTVPTGSFTDPDAGDSLSYTATLSDGMALPSWLTFNASTRKFTGTVPIGALDSLSVRVTATDQGGLAIQDVFNIAVTVQNLTLNGTTSAETLTGRSGNDTINGMGGNDTLIGNAGNDRLIGGTGNDTMSGGTGDDTYVVDSATDVVNESANEGKDTVESSLTWTLGANLENLTLTGTTAISGTGNALDNVLTGNSAVNTLTGNAGNDVLDGQAGADTMKGGAGDDTYYADNASDVVTELANEGTDTVISTLTHTLAVNVENLRLNATGAINGTGNTLDNVLYAGAGNNTLNGLGGSDAASYLYAGSAVTVSLASTSAQATGGSGSDTLQNIENLTGSSFNDTLTGSSVANVLDGGAGNDTLTGGAGNDTYRLGRGSGSDTIVENDATSGNSDLALFGSDIATDQLWFRQAGNNLEVSVIGTTDKFTLNNWYMGSQYHVEQFKTSDGRVLSDSNVQNLVQAMASFSPPAAGQTTLPANYQSSLNSVIVANWQ
ncbi:Bifunctional hemolysin/adenylate cyclase precursor [compost metagenome]